MVNTLNIKKRKNIIRSLQITGLIIFILIQTGCNHDTGLPCPIPTESMGNPGEGSVPFYIQNDTCVTFCNVNIAPSQCDDWGYDWIRNDSLRTGDTVILQLPPGKYEVLLEDCTGLNYIFGKQILNGESGLVLSNADKKMTNSCLASVSVINNQKIPICHMWIATENSDSFGGNWLGKDQILPGESRQFFVFPGEYMIKAEGCEFEVMKVEMEVEVESHITWPVE
ncbi:MAG: hypothetical protein JEZ06_03305 [Anaerolineaceae bacterium]|nr:hypothetical protein [Anaerolineaceae bacterium]